jgi:glucosyl-3-phosphoglycerate synthase
MVTVPAEKSLSEAANQTRAFRDLFEGLIHSYPGIYAQAQIRVDHCPLELILAEIGPLQVDLLLVDWPDPSAQTGGMNTNDILQHARCDTVLMRGTSWDANGPVLLSLRGGPNLTLASKVAMALAGDNSITLFHAADNQKIRNISDFVRAVTRIVRAVTARSSIFEGILSEASGHKAIVLGATFQHPEIAGSSSSPLVERLATTTPLPLVLVRSWLPEASDFHAPLQPLQRSESLSTRVDRWFAENTYHSYEFEDRQALLALKEKQGLTISLGLPALNEAETIGNVISTIKRSLMDEVPLLDEIVLIDSDSTDDTVPIAKSFGIPTYKHPEILSEMNTVRGKGEALWKSLHVLKGDIILWIDTDITNIHPRFVYGLLGPLLRRPNLQFVKGFYQRPINVDGHIQATGGGRVTELVARPMLNLFYPELSGIIQPLSGEYAGRREALESIPFFSGYGVETGMLIDLHQRYGLESIAQVDLEERIHYNQPLVGLSKMAFAITQVFIDRLQDRYNVSLLEHANRSMKLIVSEPDRFALDIVEIGDVERPPMNTIPAYRSRHESAV